MGAPVAWRKAPRNSGRPPLLRWDVCGQDGQHYSAAPTCREMVFMVGKANRKQIFNVQDSVFVSAL
jgi:hypothetical protein